MKKLGLIFGLACMNFAYMGCQSKEEVTPKQASIVGEWVRYSEFSGYFNGGDFQWHIIDEGRKTVLKFNADSTYTYRMYGNSAPFKSGQYLLKNMTLTTEDDSTAINVLNDSLLIFSYPVDEGFVLDKYKK